MSTRPYRFFRTSDGLNLRYGHWPCNLDQCRGTVVILGGRAEFLEKYLETIREINGRGFDAFGFDWRGQGASQRLLDNPTKGYVNSYSDYVRDLKQVLDEVVGPKSPKPLYLLAHSMGAHIALRYLSEHVHAVSGAVLIAPMADINTEPLPSVVLRLLSAWMVRIGWHGVVVPSPYRNDVLNKSFRRNRLTSDPERFRRVQKILRDQPQLAVAGVTYGWLLATFNSIDALHSTSALEGIDIPILLTLAGRDKVVSNAATRELALKLPNTEIVDIREARHEILQERDIFRSKFWSVFDLFVKS